MLAYIKTLMNILNLPNWEIIEAREGEFDYVINAKYTPEPVACIRCGVMGQLYRQGKTLVHTLPHANPEH